MCYWAMKPPSTIISAPVMNADSSEARYTATAATPTTTFISVAPSLRGLRETLRTQPAASVQSRPTPHGHSRARVQPAAASDAS